MMSGKVIPDDAEMEALVDVTLMKPVDLERIRAAIAEALKEAPRPGA
jgi:hypothetical protein